MEQRKFTYREGILLLLLLIIAAVIYLCTLFQPKGSTVIIEQDGKPIKSVELSSLSSPELLQLGEVTIELSRDGAGFVSSPCSDKVCVNAGMLSHAGEAAVCLPERISIRIVGSSGNDSITG